MKTQKTDRAAFERWASNWHGLPVSIVREQRCDENAYVDADLDLAWAAWQEALSRLPASGAESRDVSE